MTKIAKSLIAAGAIFGATQAGAIPVQWSGNGHHYEYISGYYTFAQAQAAAAASTYLGFSGYLVTITSVAEQEFISAMSGLENTPLNPSPYWMGASDAATEGDWRWITGPEAGQTLASTYQNWLGGQPSTAADELGGQNYAMGNWLPGNEKWNDMWNALSVGYIVEYGDTNVVSSVPVPAGLPLLLTGLVALGLRRRLV